MPHEPRVTGLALSQGQKIDRYFVLSLLGQGSSGEVYAVFDPRLERRVALKLLVAGPGIGQLSGETNWGAIVREAQTLARLSHPHVVAVYDIGVFEDRNFMTMELET